MVRAGRPARTGLGPEAVMPVGWKIVSGKEVMAEGRVDDRFIDWPAILPEGSYRVQLNDAAGVTEEIPLIVAPPRAFAGDFERGWLLAVQLYGIRSARNWGIGDFTDLEALIELAGQLGADGVGLNPLHALFDDRPGDCSPYSPNSRLFLNPLYIDVARLPGGTADDDDDLARLRASDVVDYAAVDRTEMAGPARGLQGLQGGNGRRTAAGIHQIPFRTEAAAVALRLFRGAAAQIPEAMVGLARTLAAAQ